MPTSPGGRAAVETPDASPADGGGALASSVSTPGPVSGGRSKPFRRVYRPGLGATIIAEFPMDLSDALIEIAGDWNDRDGIWPASDPLPRGRGWLAARGEFAGFLAHCELQRKWRAGEVELTGYRDSTAASPEVEISRRAISRVASDEDAIEALLLDELRLEQTGEVFFDVRVHLTDVGRAARWWIARAALPEVQADALPEDAVGAGDSRAMKRLSDLMGGASPDDGVFAVLARIGDGAEVTIAMIGRVLEQGGLLLDQEKQTFRPLRGGSGGRPPALCRAMASARRDRGEDPDSVMRWLRSFPDLRIDEESVARALR